MAAEVFRHEWTCAITYFDGYFFHNPQVIHVNAIPQLMGQTWRPFFRLHAQNIYPRCSDWLKLLIWLSALNPLSPAPSKKQNYIWHLTAENSWITTLLSSNGSGLSYRNLTEQNVSVFKKKKKLELTRMTLKMCLKKEGKKRQLCGATICEFINRKEAMKPLNLKFHFSSEERLGVHVYICVV